MDIAQICFNFKKCSSIPRNAVCVYGFAMSKDEMLLNRMAGTFCSVYCTIRRLQIWLSCACAISFHLLCLTFCVLFFQADKITTILKAAGVSVEPYWPGLFSKALDGINVKELITKIGSSAGSAPAGGAAAPAAAPVAEAKKEEKKEESESEDEDMSFGLFD